MTVSDLESDVRRAWSSALETGGRVDERERHAFRRDPAQAWFWTTESQPNEGEVERDFAEDRLEVLVTDESSDAALAERPGLHRAVQSVDAAIEKSRHLTELLDDWDGDGSQGYSQAVWERATDFVRESVVRLWVDYGRRLEPPVFLPGPAGGIDIEWSVGPRSLIIRVPTESDGRAEFYGHQTDCLTIKGEAHLTCADSLWLFTWIAK
jgi:hypothetical protein